jgi:hypothetical protein
LAGLAACGLAPDGSDGGTGLEGKDRSIAWERLPVYAIGGAEAEG